MNNMDHRRRILLFPAGIAQREAFIEARKMGLYIVSVDRCAEACCADLSDEFYVLDPSDIDQLIDFVSKYHKNHPLAGVLLVGCDLPISCATVSDFLGSPGISVETAKLTVDKLLMKHVLKENGVRVPDFFEVHNSEDVQRILSEKRTKMIIKPNDNCGARGVLQLNDTSDCEEAFRISYDNSKTGRVIMEVFEEGPQISIEALVYNREVYVTGFADRNYHLLDEYFPYVLEDGASMPTLLSFLQKKEVVDEFIRAVQALGFENGIAKGDMVYTEEGAKVIEVAGRISGGKFASVLVPEATGVNLLRAALTFAIGDKPDLDSLKPVRSQGVAVRYMFPRNGKLFAVKGIEKCRADKKIKEIIVNYTVGDIIPPIRSHVDRGGWVVCVDSDRDNAVAKAEQAVEDVEFIVER